MPNHLKKKKNKLIRLDYGKTKETILKFEFSHRIFKTSNKSLLHTKILKPIVIVAARHFCLDCTDMCTVQLCMWKVNSCTAVRSTNDELAQSSWTRQLTPKRTVRQNPVARTGSSQPARVTPTKGMHTKTRHCTRTQPNLKGPTCNYATIYTTGRSFWGKLQAAAR